MNRVHCFDSVRYFDICASLKMLSSALLKNLAAEFFDYWHEVSHLRFIFYRQLLRCMAPSIAESAKAMIRRLSVRLSVCSML